MKNSDIFHISAQSMFSSRNKKNNVYPYKPQFYYIKVGFKGGQNYIGMFSWCWSLTLLLLNTPYPVLANSVDPDQLASEEANWSGSAIFVMKYVNFYQKPGSSNLIGRKLEMGVAP